MPEARVLAATETDGSSEQGRAPSGRRRGRRRGVEVRPGSVKQARAEAGLSLGQIARDDVSRTAIYFVETGKAKPSLETLQLIAARTNKPLDFFLGQAGRATDDAALAELERLVAVGDNTAAVTAGEALVSRTADVRIAAQARLHMATACVRAAQPGRARALASAARMFFEQAGDVQMAAEAQSWEAAGALMLYDPAALGLAEDALARCRALKPVPLTTEARILSILGTVLNSRHEYARSIEVYEQAVAIGSAFPDLRALSYVYANLSLAYQELGRYADATRYARRALAIQGTLQDKLSIARSENNLALLVYKQGDLAGAFAHAEKSLRLQDELGVEVGKAHVLMTLAELELARSRHHAAATYAHTALELAQRLGESVNVGEAHTWLGRIAASRGDHATTDAEFTVALQIYASVDATEWLARGHYVYAEILEARGDLAAANRHLRRAMSALGMPSTGTPDVRVAIA